MKKCYISGPISKGNKAHNYNQSIIAHKQLLKLGYSVLNPILTILIEELVDCTWEEWIASDVEWVKVSDCLLRLPGPSRGADVECGVARDCGIPVFFSIEELVKGLPA